MIPKITIQINMRCLYAPDESVYMEGNCGQSSIQGTRFCAGSEGLDKKVDLVL